MDTNFYRRHLPHLTPSGADYFITFHLAGSLPAVKLRERRDLEFRESGLHPPDDSEQLSRLRKLYFAGYDELLHAQHDIRYLQEDRVAEIVQNAIHALEKELHFDLWGYTIVSNHVHLLFQHPSATANDTSLELRKTMQLLKGRSAFQCNRLLGRHGAFWQDESFDHVARADGEFERIVLYILNNPVKAGLVEKWSDWKWTYVHPKIREMLGL